MQNYEVFCHQYRNRQNSYERKVVENGDLALLALHNNSSLRRKVRLGNHALQVVSDKFF